MMISGKFNTGKICAHGNYADKQITKLHKY